MLRNIAIKPACTLIFLAALAASCHKKGKETQEDTSYAPNHSVAEKTFTDVQNIADMANAAGSGNTLNYKTTATTSMGSATVTRATNSVVIDFGTANCACHDGRTRRGKIIIACTGAYGDSGSVHTITFDNYYQDGNKVTGVKTVTNMGHNAAGQPCCQVTVHGGVTLTGGGTISADWVRVRTWIAGYATPADFSDDVYSISGEGTMTSPGGAKISVSIQQSAAVIVASGCKWIEAGTIIFTLPNGGVRTLNYGTTPVCDNKAQVTLPSGKIIDISKP